mmetsp:Transcript_6525/g.19389  ORF Transcript_6525/g.19389 Transcript_6525/m.19389 type:complete len:362 (-) Transcript_6525:726-1811(-)
MGRGTPSCIVLEHARQCAAGLVRAGDSGAGGGPRDRYGPDVVEGDSAHDRHEAGRTGEVLAARGIVAEEFLRPEGGLRRDAEGKAAQRDRAGDEQAHPSCLAVPLAGVGRAGLEMAAARRHPPTQHADRCFPWCGCRCRRGERASSDHDREDSEVRREITPRVRMLLARWPVLRIWFSGWFRRGLGLPNRHVAKGLVIPRRGQLHDARKGSHRHCIFERFRVAGDWEPGWPAEGLEGRLWPMRPAVRQGSQGRHNVYFVVERLHPDIDCLVRSNCAGAWFEVREDVERIPRAHFVCELGCIHTRWCQGGYRFIRRQFDSFRCEDHRTDQHHYATATATLELDCKLRCELSLGGAAAPWTIW